MIRWGDSDDNETPPRDYLINIFLDTVMVLGGLVILTALANMWLDHS
jgi:hypothetical protein